jgi:hypothetical protein
LVVIANRRWTSSIPTDKLAIRAEQGEQMSRTLHFALAPPRPGDEACRIFAKE